jgi:MSHA biogenesis protein MshI
LHDILTFFKPKPGLTCIQIHDHGIAIVRVCQHNASPVISECLYRPLTSEHGLNQTLQTMSKELGLNRSRCTTLLDEQHYKLLLTDRPKVPDNELVAALRWQIKDMIDQPVEETTFEVFPAPAVADIAAPESSYVVAANNTAIQQHVEPLVNANINLHSIDITEMALRNLTMLAPEEGHSTALVWLGEDQGKLIITHNGEIYLSRPISMGINDIKNETQDGLAHDNTDALILEIQRSLDYYESRYQTSPITHILLAPGIATSAPQIATAIQQTLALDTSTLELDQYIDHNNEMPDNWQTDFFIPIGAALRNEEAAA